MAQHTIILAGGCFWGVQELIRRIPGVIETEAGYAGGQQVSPRYNDVKQGNSGHAESVRVVYDDNQLSLQTLLVEHFFRLHDPTTRNRQGNDHGSQYRSAIFCFNNEQLETALAARKIVAESGLWPNTVVTEVLPAGKFWSAEDEHQDYLQKFPNGYTCHFYR
ncbi:MAG: peptide-methionine (S)-S-oxide reductase MsrA [Gammaproteobacteria bacterium]